MDFLSQLNAARILVAERDQDLSLQICERLEQEGYNVQRAYFAGDAIFELEHNQFDLALVDTEMAERDRPTLAAQMNQFAPLPWIGLAANASHAQAQGAASVLLHPIDMDALIGRISRVLAGEREETAPRRTAPLNANNPLLERRLIEQQTLSELARLLSAELSLDALLTKIAEAAVKLCNAEEGMLLLPDGEAKTLYIRAYTGIDQETAKDFRVKTGDTLAGQVFHTGRPILLGDQGWQKLKTEYLVQSLLYVPLSIKGDIIGVLGINNRTTNRTFTPHDTDLLQDLAAHAAIAIENARLYENSVQRTRELSLLVQAGEATNSTLAIDRVLSIINGQLISALGVSQCLVAQWQPDFQCLETLAARYEAQWKLSDAPRVPELYHETVRQAFRSKQIQIQVLESAPENTVTTWMPHGHAASVIHVPLLAQGQPLGIVLLYHLAQPFDGKLDRNKESRLQSQALEAVGTIVVQEPPHGRQAILRALRHMIELVQADWGEVAVWNGSRGTFNIAASYGEAIWQTNVRPTIDLQEYPQLRQRLIDQEIYTDINKKTGAMPPFALFGHGKSSLAIPLVIKGSNYGVVLLTDTLQARRFTRREIELAQALVLQAANAIDNAHLFHELELSLEELQRTQSKLVQTARLSAMGELAAAVAHQINNPLTTILGDAEMLLMDMAADDNRIEPVEAISRAGKRAHEVVRRLLTMARQQAPDEPIEIIDLNETITNTLMLVKGHIQQGRVELISDLASEPLPIEATPGQLEDVWLNLLLNARDAAINCGNAQIGISTRLDQERNRIEAIVWDNGIGIPDDQLGKIFVPFFTTKPVGEGTGLGLHICRQVVEKCHGSIHVESTYNQGTRFIIHLPIYDRREL